MRMRDFKSRPVRGFIIRSSVTGTLGPNGRSQSEAEVESV
jgi:hypothetical protein